MNTWMKALNNYLYPVKLDCYKLSHVFPNYFKSEIAGDRNSTIRFEDYFRENAQESIGVYFEVVFWKLYSQKRIRHRSTSRIVNYMLENGIEPQSLYKTIQQFVEAPRRQSLRNIRNLLGIKTDVLAVALTFPAFLKPERYPMVDNNVARWVNMHFTEQSKDKRAKLTPFSLRYTSLRDNDFPNYINWVDWCNEMAQILSKRTRTHWRARDVEMAVFTAERRNRELNAL